MGERIKSGANHIHEGTRESSLPRIEFGRDICCSLANADQRVTGEIFNGDPPFAPRGCTAQTWTVGELLRAWTTTAVTTTGHTSAPALSAGGEEVRRAGT